ncbi:MAG: glycosyltransferase family 4 protein [Kiritimatiellia bacterium]
MKQRLIINGTALSEPGTMGGNTKIFLEAIRCLCDEYDIHVILSDSKVKTIEDAVPERARISLHQFPQFARSEFRHPFASVEYCRAAFVRILDELGVGPSDWFFSASDFHFDALTSWFLQRRYGFKWFPSAFLFVPSPWSNLRKGYGFPVFTYTLAWLYARFFMFFSRGRAAAYVITNEDDFRHFPKRFREGRLFPFYGGVNVDQIPRGEVPKTRDVVFCSRLCAQKGIMGFLDIWKRVHDRLPEVRFTLIGNGTPGFEVALHEKAGRLGVEDSIDWMGYVNNAAKYEIYRSARVMVHPTVFDNNGMVAAEALCSGLPVVMYDLPPLRHVYTTGCRKVPFGDQAAFADEVVRLLSDPGYAAQVAPSSDQVDELRAFWNWPNRVAKFKSWLECV